jgi:hypothetical protein
LEVWYQIASQIGIADVDVAVENWYRQRYCYLLLPSIMNKSKQPHTSRSVIRELRVGGAIASFMVTL